MGQTNNAMLDCIEEPRLNNTCRTCLDISLNPKELSSLFESKMNIIESAEVWEVTHWLQLGIKKDDGLPQLICAKCLGAFTSISKFRKQCIDVQSRLEDIFLSTNTDNLDFKSDTEELISFEVIIMNSDDEVCETELQAKGQNNEHIVENYAYEDKETCNPRNNCLLNENEIIENSKEDATNLLDNPHDKNLEAAIDSTNSELSKHTEFSSSETLYTSTVPEMRRRRAIRNNHLQTRKVENCISCDICGLNFKSRIYALSHKRSTHKNTDHKCSICLQTTRNLKCYNYHVRSHNPVKKYKCSYCDRSFMQQHHVLNHERTHTGLEPYLCNVCGRTFKQEASLKKHLSLHSGERPYDCNICRKSFAQRGGFVLHMRGHNNIRPYQCEICGKNFIQKSSLTTHLRVHTGDRPFKCELCRKTFVQAHQLKYHKYSAHQLPVIDKKETDTKTKPVQINPVVEQESSIENIEAENCLNVYPYSCPVCSRGFKLPSSLKTHLKCHSEERKHICKECGSTFKRAEHLRIHINGVHLKKKPYACDYCEKTFSQSGDRNIHMKQHTIDKPHKCQYCSKGFRLQKSLRAHERIHTGEKPYTCEICTMCFISYNALAIHTMKHSYVEKQIVNEKTLQEFTKSIDQNKKTSSN